MSDVIKTGDFVEITIRGTVRDRTTHNSTHRIAGENGSVHYVYLGGDFRPIREGEKKYSITVKKVEYYEAGEAYKDADGDVFLRTRDGKWLSSNGSEYDDSYATRPLRKLVPES